jgi:hypothetical protein
MWKCVYIESAQLFVLQNMISTSYPWSGVIWKNLSLDMRSVNPISTRERMWNNYPINGVIVTPISEFDFTMGISMKAPRSMALTKYWTNWGIFCSSVLSPFQPIQKLPCWWKRCTRTSSRLVPCYRPEKGVVSSPCSLIPSLGSTWAFLKLKYGK